MSVNTTSDLEQTLAKSNLEQTVYNMEWMQQHEKEVKDLLPQTLTHVQNFNWLQFGFRLKLMGIDWRDSNDLPKIMTFFTRIGLITIHGDWHMKVNPNTVFNAEYFFVA